MFRFTIRDDHWFAFGIFVVIAGALVFGFFHGKEVLRSILEP